MPKTSQFQKLLGVLDKHSQDRWSERVAIVEYMAGVSRDLAEQYTATMMLKEHGYVLQRQAELWRENRGK